MRKVFLLSLLILSFSCLAQSNSEAIIIGRGVVRTQLTNQIIGKFELSDNKDTLLVEMSQMFNVQKALPTMATKLEIDPSKVRFLKERQPSGKTVYRELAIVIPEVKKNKKASPNSNSIIALGYSIGRHTDQLDIKVRYYNTYGIHGIFGNSFYRGDLSTHFLFLGASNDFEYFRGTKWQGVISLGPIAVAKQNTNELEVGAAIIFNIEREFTENIFFGPRLIIGNYNELGFCLSTRF